MKIYHLVIVAALLAGGLALGGGVRKGPTPNAAAFLADARAGTERYRTQRAAIEDGFTRVGVEFPAMGEHWVSFARLLEDSLAAGRPSVLIYVNTTDGPALAGVAYTKLLTGDTPPPAFPFEHAWHEHSGAVNEESLPLAHEMHGGANAAAHGVLTADSPRLFILHAWLYAPNPDGDFATDNWTLPMARVGVAPDSTVPRGAAKALALADDDDQYHRFVLNRSLSLSPSEDSLAAGVLRQTRREVAADATSIRATRHISREQSKRLSETWYSLWSSLERALPARHDALERLRASM